MAETDNKAVFDLLETLRWDPSGGFSLLDEHLERLAGAAEYFGYIVDVPAIRDGLAAAVTGLDVVTRVRLLVGRDGTFRIAATALDLPTKRLRVGLARDAIDRADPFLNHKTTHRGVYDHARAACPELDDVILYDAQGYVTETTIANIVVEVEGRRLTPQGPGLLPGTFRRSLLEAGEIREGAIHVATLPTAARLWLINSVRDWIDVEFVA